MKNKILLIIFFAVINLQAQDAGTLDTSYGNNGEFEYTITVGNTLYGIIVSDSYTLSDGKILVIGVAANGCSQVSSHSGIIAKFNTDGTFDTSFNQTGFKLTPTEAFRQLISITNDSFYILSNSKVYKMDSQGNSDNTFGTNGIVNLTYFNKAFKKDSNNNLIIVSTYSASSSQHYARRLLSDGTLDNSFADNGLFTFESIYSFQNLALDSNDNIFITGKDNTSSSAPKLVVFALNNNGGQNANFADNGVFELQPYVVSQGNLIQLDSENKILVSGYGNYLGYYGLILVRLDIDGNLDTSFKNSGYLHKRISSESIPTKTHLTINNIYVTGTGFSKLYIAKFDNNGNSDSGFGTNGYVLSDSDSSTFYCRSSEFYDDHIIIIGARSFADCLQTKYKLTLSKYFIENETLTVSEEKLAQLKIYPNPFLDKIIIQTDYENYKVSITDINGRIIPVYIDNNILNTRHLSSGIYILKINLNNTVKYYKIVKN